MFLSDTHATAIRIHISIIVKLYHDTAASTTTTTTDHHHHLLLFRLIYIHIHTGFECIFNITIHYCKMFWLKCRSYSDIVI